MPPTAPTISSITDGGGYASVNFTNSGTGDHNQLFRRQADEYDGLAVKIADPVTWSTASAAFRDYSARSGIVYSYQMIAVDSGGGTAASAIKTGSVSLSRGYLHTVKKNYQVSSTLAQNADTVLQLLDIPAQTRDYTLDTDLHMMIGGGPLLHSSSIEKNKISPPAISTYGSGDYRTTLRSLYLSSFYLCLRDVLGNRWFGRLLPPTEQYDPTLARLGLILEELAFNEAV